MLDCPFFEEKVFALYGMSRRPSKFGNAIFKHLTRHGYTVYPIHPEAEELEGARAYRSLADLPQPVTSAIINVPPEAAARLIGELAEAGIKRVFLQQGSQSDEVLAQCRAHGLKTYYKSCAILNSKPTGAHAIHAFFANLFGGGARELE